VRLRPTLMPMTIALLALLLTAACGDDDAPAQPDPVEREIAVYVATIRALVVDADPGAEADGPAGVVYVASRDEQPIGVDVQAGVVVELDGWATIRFVDTDEEAIDSADPAAPVRDEGLLLGLGSVPDGAFEVEVYADRYDGPERTIVYAVRLRRVGANWTLAEELRGVPVAVSPDEGS